ncbi:MAG: extracellular solute-binding protein [Faecalicoccus sp.]|nr:extracellular solute-binding protein [Faecalicoccus sp.]
MKKMYTIALSSALALSGCLSGCSAKKGTDGVVEIEIVQYKPEAVEVFNQLEEEFNKTHDDIHLTIESPNDAMTIMKTRFIREDYPDIIGIGGDVNYSNFVDAELLADVSDYSGIDNVKEAYVDIIEGLEFVPTEGTFGVPYMANAAGVLYNRDMFEEHGWEIPTTWSEFIQLCKDIEAEGIQPLYFGYKDTWTTLAPWNALAVDLAPADICQQVNSGDATFTESYREVAEKQYELLQYAEKDPFAYGYNDACTEFARENSAMYIIGSYAVPQILSVNPDLNIDSFVMPGSDDADQQTLNSGVDLMFCLMENCEHKEEAYVVLDFLLKHDNMQYYIDVQNAVPCTEGDFELPAMLDGMKEYIDQGKMADFQDHHYPSEMAVDAQIQTFLIEGDVDKFLKKFDTDWVRYNRDIIRKVQAYNESR